MVINSQTHTTACVILPIHPLFILSIHIHPKQNVPTIDTIKETNTVNTPSWTRNLTHDNKTRTRMYTSFFKRVAIKEKEKHPRTRTRMYTSLLKHLPIKIHQTGHAN